MKNYDFCNGSLSPENSALAKTLNDFAYEIITNGKQAIGIVTVAEENPDAILPQCFSAALFLYGQENKLTQKSIGFLKHAEPLLRTSNQRERMYYQAIEAWSKCNYELAITLFTALTELDPQDIVAAKMAEWLFYCTGQYYQAQRFLAMCEAMSKPNKKNPYFLSTYSFAAELSGQRKLALKLAEKSLSVDPGTAWSHHTLSHAYLLNAEMQQGLQVLKDAQPHWDSIIPSLKCHLDWHLGLFYIAETDFPAAMEVYQQEIWGEYPNTVAQQIDAISYLWRLDMAGHHEDEAWQAISQHLNQHPFEYYMPFNNMHFIYALVRADKNTIADKAIRDLQKYCEQLSGESYERWHTIGLPLIVGTRAFANQDYKLAYQTLEPTIEASFCTGGSDAQDELMTQMYYITLLKNQKQNQAQTYADKYLSHYKSTALYQNWNTL